jgi:hypothetical protein
MPRPVEELLIELWREGGAVVCAMSCTAEEIAEAEADDRHFENENGIGFVRRSSLWLIRKDYSIPEPPKLKGPSAEFKLHFHPDSLSSAEKDDLFGVDVPPAN